MYIIYTSIPAIIICLSSKLDSNGRHFKDATIEDIPDAKNEKDEEEKDEKKKLNSVGIFELFAFADKWDIFWIILGMIGAIVAGSIFPIMFAIFGNITTG